MKYSPTDHTFVICAYQESQYLEECIQSLLSQTVKSTVILATSTPSDFIFNLCDMYSIPVFINKGEKGIAGDWNFALSCADTELITIAHQDDIYEQSYTEEMLKCMNRVKYPVLFSSDYSELRNGGKVRNNRLLQIKKVMRFPMWLLPGSIAARRLMLSFGDPICCPSVTYVRSMINRHPFCSGLLASLDWQQWEALSKEKGSFAYCNSPLMAHRIHEESETSRVISKYSRTEEDFAMYRKFWPEPVARLLAKLYSASEKSNTIKTEEENGFYERT